MKTIIAATDFSANAKTAVFYAAELARRMHARLVLVHAYHFPIALTEAPLAPDAYDDLALAYEKNTKDLALEVLQKIDHTIPIDCITVAGFAVDVIVNVGATQNAEMIVIGTQGASRVELALLGSNAASVIRKSKIPVLVVPPDTQYHTIKSIVLACNKCDLVSPKAYGFIREFAEAFEAKVSILDIVHEHEEMAVAQAETSRIQSELGALAPAVHIAENKDVVSGIKNYLDESKADMLVMIPAQHSFFERMFTEIHTRHMAASTTIPMLTISC